MLCSPHVFRTDLTLTHFVFWSDSDSTLTLWKLTIQLIKNWLHLNSTPEVSEPGLCSTQIFRTDSTLTHVTIQVIHLWHNSTLYFSWLTQLQFNSNSKFVPKPDSTLTQLIWVRIESNLTHDYHILPNLAKGCWLGKGGGAVVCICRLVLSL